MGFVPPRLIRPRPEPEQNPPQSVSGIFPYEVHRQIAEAQFRESMAWAEAKRLWDQKHLDQEMLLVGYEEL